MYYQRSVAKLAKLISRLLGTMTLPPIIYVLLFSYSGTNWRQDVVSIVFFFITAWVLPVCFFLVSLLQGWIKDIDATDRRDRYLPYTFGIVCLTVSLLISFRYFPGRFIQLYLPFYFSLAVVFLITFFYKISAHAVVNTYLYLFLNEVSGWEFWWLFLLVILVGWSRWVQKKHTVLQLVLGVFVVVIIWVILKNLYPLMGLNYSQ